MRRLLFLSFTLGVFLANAQNQTPKYVNEFMNLGAGARSFGLGLSSVAYVNDPTAGYWNPAGLVRLENPNELILMHTGYFGGLSNYDFAAFASKIDKKTAFGVSFLRFAVDDIPDTRYLFDSNGQLNYDNIQYFSAADYALLVSYARRLKALDGIDVGGNVKVIRRVVGDFASSWGFGFDFSIQKHIKGLSFGVMGKDILGTFNGWTYNTEELEAVYVETGNQLPSESLEIALPRLIFGVSYLYEWDRKKYSLLYTLDLNATFDGKRNTLVSTDPLSLDPYGGVEFGFKKIVFVRAGVSQLQQVEDFESNTSWSLQPSAGVGLHFKELTIDYAFTDVGNVAEGLYSHVFSLKVDFQSNAKK